MSIAPLRAVAKKLGIVTPLIPSVVNRYTPDAVARAGADLDPSAVHRYLEAVNALNALPRGGRRLSQEGMEMVAHAVLEHRPLSTCTFVCVSDYVGGVRFRAQSGVYALTTGELTMFERATQLRQQLAAQNVELQWTLMLADAWGLELYPDRLEPGAIDAYCAFMTAESSARWFAAQRWTTLMNSRQEEFETACMRVEETAARLAPQEVRSGEIGKDRPATDRALSIAQRHITYRAAEGVIMVKAYGPTIVLSTEDKALCKYDNLLAPQSVYPAIDFMPKSPHRLP